MKIKKGDAGYIRKRKIQLLIKMMLEFGVVIALLVLGITQTGDRINVLTIVAVLGCIPASKAMVEWIVILPYHSTEEAIVTELKETADALTIGFDMVVTDNKRFMPIDCIVIMDNTICGFSSSKKIDATLAGKHIRDILYQNKYTKETVKIFTDYAAFIARAEEMQKIAEKNSSDTKAKEEALRHLILQISL